MKKNFISLLDTNPELSKEWHPYKNGNLTPADVSAGSHEKVWWYLPYDVPDDYPIEHLRGKHFNFEWQATISHRNRGNGCPFLSRNAVWKGFNDLQTINPELAAQWHPTKNESLKPTNVAPNSKKKVWWYLSYDAPDDYPIEHLRGKHFDFEWQERIDSRHNYELKCPYLSGHAIWVGFNDLATVNPRFTSEWHPTKNGNLTPADVTASCKKKSMVVFTIRCTR